MSAAKSQSGKAVKQVSNEQSPVQNVKSETDLAPFFFITLRVILADIFDIVYDIPIVDIVDTL